MAVITDSFTIIKRPVKVENTNRWIRVKFNQEIIASSKNVKLLIDYPGGIGVAYFFPIADVKMDFLKPYDKNTGKYKLWDVQVGEKMSTRSAYMYNDPSEDRQDLTGYISFKWREMDNWYEEEEEIVGHPRDPYHRVDTIESSRHVKIVIEGITIAETTRPHLLFETHLPTRYYIPKEDINMDYLKSSDLSSICPYKGSASYWNINVNGKTFKNHVWSYLDPLSEIPKIKGLLAFYDEKLDVFVDGELQIKPKTKFI